MDTERKLFAEQARNSAPQGIKIIDQDDKEYIPDEHTCVIIEVLSEGDDGLFYRIVGTADCHGIGWAWRYAKENHPRPEALRIIDMEETAVNESLIEIH